MDEAPEIQAGGESEPEKMTTVQLRREWVKLYAVGRSISEMFVVAGLAIANGDKPIDQDGEDKMLTMLIGNYRRIERRWDRVDDLLLEREQSKPDDE